MTKDDALIALALTLEVTGERTGGKGCFLPWDPIDKSMYGEDFDKHFAEISKALYDAFDVTHYDLYKENGKTKIVLYRNAGFGCSWGGPIIYETGI